MIPNPPGSPLIGDFVDLEQYPIDRLDQKEGKRLIDRCRRMMREQSICILPGFLNPATTSAIASEINNLERHSGRVDFLATPYGWMENTGFPADHPRSLLFPRRCNVLTTEQIDTDGVSQRLYQCDALTEFVRRLLDYPTLYRTACPTISVRVNLMRQHDEFGWHFDTNDGVVSFITQNAERGGVFEFAPLIRNEDDENYDGVTRLIGGDAPARQADTPPGTFTLFMGRRSMHRVSRVGKTTRSRQSLLFAYHTSPGMVFPERIRKRLLEPSDEPFRGLG